MLGVAFIMPFFCRPFVRRPKLTLNNIVSYNSRSVAIKTWINDFWIVTFQSYIKRISIRTLTAFANERKTV